MGSVPSAGARRRVVHPVFLAALGLTLVVAAGVSVFALREHFREKKKDIEKARAIRTTALVEVAPCPLPNGLPLAGTRPHVDMAAVRSLFWHRKFAELTDDFEKLQDAFEADPKKEHWPGDATDAFSTAEPQLAAKLDAWVAATPGSFAPYLARGDYELAVAQATRGRGWEKDTARADTHAMQAPLAKATADLRKAIALRPKLVTALRRMIVIAAWYGDAAEKNRLVAAAASVCPECLAVRETYLLMSTPRWGGSYAAMHAFAASAPVAKNPALAVLDGFPDYDQAQLARYANDLGKASLAIERALSHGEDWHFLLERAEIRQARKDWTASLADLDRANELRPGIPEVLIERAYTLDALRRTEEAGESLLEGVRITATDPVARKLFPRIVNNIQYDGWQAHKAGKRDEALRYFDLAAQLAPSSHDVISRRAWIILGSDHPDIPALEAAVKAHPDDLRLHQQLDYALSRHHDWARIAAMWTEYIARHPDDATAYRERMGTYHNMGRMAESRADAKKACELGDDEGCLHM
jgi:tetratricopeptide (TPR) repeat protein